MLFLVTPLVASPSRALEEASFAGETNLTATATSEMTIRLSADAKLPWFDAIDFHTDGDYAGLLMEYLPDEPPPIQGRTTHAYLGQYLSGEATCGLMHFCDPVSFSSPVLVPDPSVDDFPMPAGSYRITVLTDGSHSVTARIAIEALNGSTSITAMTPTVRWSAKPMSVPDGGLALDATIKGAEEGHLTGAASVAWVTAWLATEPYVAIPERTLRFCRGHPSSDWFDEEGFCSQFDAWTSYERGLGLASGWGTTAYCWAPEDCAPGPLRQGFQFDHVTAAHHRAGGIAHFVDLTLPTT